METEARRNCRIISLGWLESTPHGGVGSTQCSKIRTRACYNHHHCSPQFSSATCNQDTDPPRPALPSPPPFSYLRFQKMRNCPNLFLLPLEGGDSACNRQPVKEDD